MSRAAIGISSAEPPRSAASLDIVPRRAAAASTASQANALPIVPQHLLQPLPPRPGPLAVGGIVLAALVLHLGFAAMLALLLQWRVLKDTGERPIPVEIVNRMPDQKTPPDKPTGAASRPADPGAPPGGSPSPSRPTSAPPPPPLVAPPPEARPATTQQAQPETANAVPEPPKPEPSRAAPPSADPAVLAAPQGGFAVPPPPTTKPPEPKPQPTPAPAPRERQGTDIAAALPMDFSALPTSFRAVLSGSGTQASEDYKGLVYGKLGRSPELAEKARAASARPGNRRLLGRRSGSRRQSADRAFERNPRRRHDGDGDGARGRALSAAAARHGPDFYARALLRGRLGAVSVQAESRSDSPIDEAARLFKLERVSRAAEPL